MDAIQVSNYVVSLIQDNPEEGLTNLKLQKILYYMQGHHLAIFGEPLFANEIEPWQYGPVVSEVYHAYKTYGNSPIVIPTVETSFDFLTEVQKKFVNKVFSYYNQFSAIKLMELAHSEDPWVNSYQKESIISNDSIQTFFSTSELNGLFSSDDPKVNRKLAAEFLLTDYLYNNDLIETTVSSIDDIYEY